MNRARGGDGNTGLLDAYTATSLVGACGLFWFTKVQDTVPEPYLVRSFSLNIHSKEN
jgi:hypothetical protein